MLQGGFGDFYFYSIVELEIGGRYRKEAKESSPTRRLLKSVRNLKLMIPRVTSTWSLASDPRAPTRSLYLTNSRLTTEALHTSRPLSIDSMKVCPLSVRGPNMKYEKSAAAGWVWNRLFSKRFNPRPQLLFGDPR
jgi:hypothetical protein